MKKLTIGLILSFISMTTFAWHLTGLGLCGGQAYFETGGFTNGASIQVRYNDSTKSYLDFTTPALGQADTIFEIPQIDPLNPVMVQFRFNPNTVGSVWSNWRGLPNSDSTQWFYTSGVNEYPGCRTAALEFTSIKATGKDNLMFVDFTVNPQVHFQSYNIMASNDAKNWTIVSTLKDTGKSEYNLSINLATGAGVVTVAFIGFAGFKNGKKKKWLFPLLSLIAIIFMVSCKKDAIINPSVGSYKFVYVQGILINGTPVKSNVYTL